MERRLRRQRQEARLRLRLLSDAALLDAHHASQAPRMPAYARGGVSEAEVRSLREELAAVRVQLRDLEARFDASVRLEREHRDEDARDGSIAGVLSVAAAADPLTSSEDVAEDFLGR